MLTVSSTEPSVRLRSTALRVCSPTQSCGLVVGALVMVLLADQLCVEPEDHTVVGNTENAALRRCWCSSAR